VADSRPHFLLSSFDWTFPFSNFLRRLGNLVAGFLTIRRSFFGIACLPLDQNVPLPPPWTVGQRVGQAQSLCIPNLGGKGVPRFQSIGAGRPSPLVCQNAQRMKTACKGSLSRCRNGGPGMIP
jgi:hypothetical protein